jgi:hypothetical protein
MAIGAGLMYFLDSDKGMSRRSQMRNRTVVRLRKFSATVDNKIRGLRKTLQATPLSRVVQMSLVPRKPVPDWVVAERIRLESWRTLAHPDSIQISVRDGRVTVWGPVLAGEPESLRRRLLKLPGVRQFELQLTTREGMRPAS